MESNPQNDTHSKRRKKLILVLSLFIVALMAVAVAMIFDADDSSSPIQFTVAPLRSPDVLKPTFNITNLCDRGVLLNLRLECQTNGQWVAWPFQAPDAGTIWSSIQLSKWKVMLKKHDVTSTLPFEAPENSISNPLRMHPLRVRGFVARETVGLPKLGERVQTYFQYHNSTNSSLRQMAWSPYFRSYPAPAEFVTSPFYMTNAPTTLTITMGEKLYVNKP